MFSIFQDVIVLGNYNFFLEMFFAYMIFMRGVKQRSGFWLRIILCLAVGALFYFMPGLGSPVNMAYIIVFFVIVVMGLFAYQSTFFNSFYAGVAAFALQNLAWNVLNLLMVEIIGLSHFVQVTGIITYIATYIGIYILSCFIFPVAGKTLKFSKRNLLILVFSVLIIVMVFILSALVSSNGQWDLYNRIYAILACVFALALQITILFSFDAIQAKALAEQEKAVIEQLLHDQGKQYQLNREAIDIIDRKCHDLKHQISALRSMDEAERNQSLNEIEEAVLLYNNIAKTSNDALNVILTDKGLLCERHNIQFTYMIDGCALDFIDTLDLCSLFGNALDNAIEEVLKEEDASKRIIKLNVTNQKGYVLIHIENYCKQPVVIHRGLPLSKRREHGRHGFGAKSIQYVAERYGGNANFAYENNLFSLDILLPIK